MTNEELAAAVDDLRATVARLEGEARHADALIALLIGIVAGKADLQLNLDIGGVSGLPPEWVELIVDRVRSGMNASSQ